MRPRPLLAERPDVYWLTEQYPAITTLLDLKLFLLGERRGKREGRRDRELKRLCSDLASKFWYREST